MKYHTLEVGAKALIYTKPGHFLVLKRKHPFAGEKARKWEIPGGRIHTGEPVKKALRREIREESGLALVEIEKILYVQDIMRNPGIHTVRVTFLARCAGRVKLNAEVHTEYRWVTLKELKNLRHRDKYLTPVVTELLNE